MLLPIIIIGTILGGILTLVACGFTLTFGVGRIFNFAHGTFFAISAYTAYALFPYLGYSSLLIGVLASAIFGLSVHYLIKPIRKNEIMVILLTLSLALLVDQIILMVFGVDAISLHPIVKGSIDVFGVKITNVKILSFAITVASIIILEWLIKRTRLGREISAVSQDVESAMIVGIDVERVFMFTLLISSVLAGIGGILYAQIYSLTPNSALEILLLAFAIVVVGGLGSVKGSVISAFIISYIKTAVSVTLGTRWSELAVLIVIIAILVVRPQGLFGVEE
ncbi:branched-chain amino acid ABC transporter permease [Archaeoglobus sp.]